MPSLPLSLGSDGTARRELVRKTWNRLRGYKPSDLSAMRSVVNRKVEQADRRSRHVATRERAGDRAEADQAMSQARAAQIELAVLDQLIMHHFNKGTSPPAWDDVSYETDTMVPNMKARPNAQRDGMPGSSDHGDG